MSQYNARLAEAYREHQQMLYRIAVARLSGARLQGEAPDVVSAAVLSLLEHPPARVENWRALLATAVERRAIDHIRSAWSKRVDGRESDVELIADDRDEILQVDDTIDVTALIRDALIALQELGEPHQTVARECLWRERKQSEVAAELAVSQPRISQVLREAKQKIRNKLEEKGEQR